MSKYVNKRKQDQLPTLSVKMYSLKKCIRQKKRGRGGLLQCSFLTGPHHQPQLHKQPVLHVPPKTLNQPTKQYPTQTQQDVDQMVSLFSIYYFLSIHKFFPVAVKLAKILSKHRKMFTEAAVPANKKPLLLQHMQ